MSSFLMTMRCCVYMSVVMIVIIYHNSHHHYAHQIVEPGYYFRVTDIQKAYADAHYDANCEIDPVPSPYVLTSSRYYASAAKSSLDDLLQQVLEADDEPRLVLGARAHYHYDDAESSAEWLRQWADDSASSWGDAPVPKSDYTALRLPRRAAYASSSSSSAVVVNEISISKHIMLCRSFLVPERGNRTCFSKCN